MMFGLNGLKKEYTQEEQARIDMIRKFEIDLEKEQETPEYIAEHARIKAMCDKIKDNMPMTTKEEIKACKEASRGIPSSYEKVLLFKMLITREENLSK